MGVKERWAQAIEDYDYLNTLGCDHDCVEIDAEVFSLMRDPSIKRALRMWEAAIEQWFWRYRDAFLGDDRANEIGERHGHR